LKRSYDSPVALNFPQATEFETETETVNETETESDFFQQSVKERYIYGYIERGREGLHQEKVLENLQFQTGNPSIKQNEFQVHLYRTFSQDTFSIFTKLSRYNNNFNYF